MKATVAKTFGLVISDAQARQVIGADLGVLDELDDSGHLDTLPRSDLASAILTCFLPGAPTVRDTAFRRTLTYWHWPVNGSSPAYRRAFTAAFTAAMAKHKIRMTDEK